MALIDELKEQSTSIEEKKREVIKEIVDYFSEYLRSEEFEDLIRRRADKQARKISFDVQYWQYVSGCSDTNFSIGNKEWRLPYDSNPYTTRYKGVDIARIQKEIGKDLYYLLEDVMGEKGFTFGGSEDKESWLGYYHKKLVFKW